MSVELCAFSVVYNDFRWNCVHVHSFMMLFGGIAVVFSSL